MKKVLIQNSEQLEMVREEIRVSSQFNHPNLLPLLDHAIIAVKVIGVLTCFFSLYIILQQQACTKFLIERLQHEAKVTIF